MEILVAGVPVYYEQHGQGPDILLLHGWMCSTELWAPITKALCAHGRVTVLDFPGHGKSGRPPEPWSVTEYAQMTETLIHALGIEGCGVVAHSFGGRVALYLAAHTPGLFRKMVLTGCAGLRKPPTLRGKVRGLSYKAMRRGLEACKALHIADQWTEQAQERLRKRFGSADYNALDAEMRKTFVRVVNQDLRDCLPRVRVPTLLYWGELDQDTPLWMAKVMQQEIPDAGLVTVPGADHYAYLYHAAAFARVVQAFMLEDNA